MRFLMFYIVAILSAQIFAQQTEIVDFKRAEVDVSISPFSKSIEGQVTFSFDVLKPADSIFIDAREMMIKGVERKGESIDFLYSQDKVVMYDEWLPKKGEKLKISYSAKPKKAMYFLGWDNEAPDQVWTQGQGKYTSHWLPSIDDMNEKLEFDITVNAPPGYTVLANGELVGSLRQAEGWTWTYNMDLPMSSYLVALVVGEFSKQTLNSSSGIPLELYYHPADTAKFEPTYRYTREIFDFLESEIGIAYPWQNYKQVPVHDFLYAGMENTGITVFSDEFMVDTVGFNDRNYVRVNAHELAHQWFGNLVTETSGTHHWLHEGFATYYALLAERKLFGEDHFFWRLYTTAMELEMQDKSGASTALMNPASSSLTFYEKGAWTLFMLRELVGDEVFRQAVRSYLDKNRFKNVSTLDFISEVEAIGEIDLGDFEKVWLESDDFPIERALDALRYNSTFLQEYLMVDCEVANSKCMELLHSPISDRAKMKIIEQRPGLISVETFRNSWRVRQSIATHLTEIPEVLRSEYESLLGDPSYITRENALYNLWINFPVERSKYLDSMRDMSGLSDKSFRILWLILHLNTPEFEPGAKAGILNELLYYTTDVHNISVRIKAFRYILQMKACNEGCKSNLKSAVKHHNWQMSKFAREQLKIIDGQ